MKNMTAMNAKRKQAGFTIIELVVVILLLGILTATALPRFMDVTDEAHAAVVDAVESGFTTGVALFRAQWVAEGQPYATLVDEFDLYASTNGYPRSESLTNTVVAGQTTVDSCVPIYEALLQDNGRPTIVAGGSTALAADDVPTREAIIEAATTADATVDFVAVLEANAAPTTVLTVSCTYFYVGQYKNGTDGVQNTIPTIEYDFTTGLVTRDTFTMLTDPTP